MSTPENRVYRFGNYELDPGERRLRANGEPVTLTPKVFETLVLLVARAGHAVSKDELMHALWPRGFVDESNLTKHIWLIRKALGDDEGRWIETVPKLGYRFAGAVEPVAPADHPEQAPSSELREPTPASANAEPVAAVEPSTLDAAHARLGQAATTSITFSSLPPVSFPVPGTAAIDTLPDPHPAIATAAPVPARTPWRRFLPLLAAALVVVGLATVWFVTRPKPVVAPSGTPGTAVAVVGFNNLGGNARDAWVGPALDEMFSTEIAVGGRLHVLPSELVGPATRDLPASPPGGYAVQSIALLRRRLGTDYVLGGSYLVSGEGDLASVRLDLALQDARTGEMAAAFARIASVGELPRMVAQAGADLRARLDIAEPGPAALRAVTEAQPPNSEVARHLGVALDALRHSDPAKARDELLEAVAQAPGYAPGYAYLAQAWSALGYGEKAIAAAEQAAAHSAGLPREQQLVIDAQLADAKHERAHAVDVWQSLVTLRPQNPDYRLQLIAAQIAANQLDGANAALVALRGLPGAADDPRTELAASDIATAGSDTKGAADHTRKALALAEARNDDGQIAHAQSALAEALDRLGGAGSETEHMLRRAIATWQRVGNPHGEAVAHHTLGVMLADVNRGDEARAELQTAMAIFQRIEDLGGMASTYTSLSRMLWAAGDSDGAVTAARKVLELGQKTGDVNMQVWGLQALATAASDEAASNDVVVDYRKAIELAKQSGGDNGSIWAQGALADVLRQRGELVEADALCRQALPIAARLTDPQFAITIGFICAEVALDRGDVSAASTGLLDVRTKALSYGDAIYTANADITLAQIDMGYRRWSDATDRLTHASDKFRQAEAWTGMADAQAFLALCAQARGDSAARDSAEAHARELRRGINSRQEVFSVDLALAELRAAHGEVQQALADLDALAADAERRHWVGWTLECRLAAVRVAEAAHDAGAASRRQRLEEQAGRLGFGWVLARLHGAGPATKAG